jgi:predicted transcriptional regulator
MRKLNPKEEQVMQILWSLQKGFVKEILAEWPEPKPPVTTLSSLVRKLEQEGWIGHEAFGKTYRYYPQISREAYLKSSFRSLVDNYFEGSSQRLLSFFVREQEVEPEQINRLLREIKDSESSEKD